MILLAPGAGLFLIRHERKMREIGGGRFGRTVSGVLFCCMRNPAISLGGFVFHGVIPISFLFSQFCVSSLAVRAASFSFAVPG